jgi:hypothetical protein
MFEKYLAGEPLNEELAAIQRGGLGPLEEPIPARESASSINADPDRELTDTERMDLRDLKLTPGWMVMQRVIQKLFSLHEKSAITLSQISPLSHRDRIAEEWAYEGMFRRAAHELLAVIDAEVKELESGPR